MHREHLVDAAPGVRLWVEERGDADAPALLLVMGAQASGVGWPDELVDALAAHHRVVRYDHRDTGRSTWSYETRPYAITDLADDALAVLDGLGVERAHVVGMSLGGMLAQLLIADHPERLRTATLIGTCALSTTPYTAPDGTVTPVGELPPIDPRILDMWAHRPVDLAPEDEMAWRVEHWRLLNGDAIPFDAQAARETERRVLAHTGHARISTAHGRADHSGMLRTEALAATDVPTLVVSAPAEPVFPPPHARHLAQVIRGARLVEVPGMGHALPGPVLEPLAKAILDHTAA
ncbi:alpha/beta fold hydrolase [Streptomyces sudanensis]|uniref:alpha/beta fold hydrolase n=1 Tax=Streptomyces sudanensis TaxID=436397 RepID=UPI0020CB6CC1|nr:alpha/beta hydrolase [Streptomyces sudanensis]MCP9958039.1 alpha/beta fold hydrolase [Streptomyces sudanensis]